MKEEYAVGILLTVGIAISLLFRTYLGIAFAAVVIPLYLTYIARDQNILAKSRLYDRDLFLMIGITATILLGFNRLWAPRVGLVALAVVIPLLALYVDRLKAGKEAQKV
ncbi:hypothetical protein [Thermococcus sp.]|uniref:hypothetical protein n=1 Tax=Thermococcus sp. TaxID=35749 RepID=UPI0026222E8C|nr:hypothetical protein [Thermococcus sp.]